MGIRVIEFKTEYRTGKDPVDWVLFTGSDAYSETGQVTSATWERVKKLQPPAALENDGTGEKMTMLRVVWDQIAPHYEAWKQGNKLPESGTPLAAWGGVNASQIAALKGIGILTVETLAGLKDSGMPAILPNMRELRSMAIRWMEGRPQAERDAEMAELKAQNEAMMEMLAELKAERATPQYDPAQTANTAAAYQAEYGDQAQQQAVAETLGYQRAFPAYELSAGSQASAAEPAEKPRRGRPPKSEAA